MPSVLLLPPVVGLVEGSVLPAAPSSVEVVVPSVDGCCVVSSAAPVVSSWVASVPLGLVADVLGVVPSAGS